MKLVIFMMNKVISLLEDNLVIPKTLLVNYKELKIKEKDLIVLIYLINLKNNTFDPNKISSDLNLQLPEVLEIIENLNSADLLSINTNKNNGILEEVIDISNLYKKLAFQVINETDNKDEEKANIYDSFEKEFGRTLSPTEYELISGWLENNYSEEIIGCALKEAVFNGVSNLKYIDKILYEWNRKGITKKEDILKDKKKTKKDNNKKEELFDYDWLNDE